MSWKNINACIQLYFLRGQKQIRLLKLNQKQNLANQIYRDKYTYFDNVKY